MSTVHDPMRETISLHGLGFIQVQLQGGQRLHVWHPDLPRRRCFEHSAIHTHRFSFESQVLVGEQINISYRAIDPTEGEDATHRLYLHEGPRTANGGRPWEPNAPVIMREGDHQTIPAGLSYRMFAYDFHRTEPGGNGRVATLMTKTGEGRSGAMSSCRIGIVPDVNFDRFQLSPTELWAYVVDVLSGGAPVQTAAARDVLAERRRQITDEGWTPENDDKLTPGSLATAAACYAIRAGIDYSNDPDLQREPLWWPWPATWWKPGDKRRMLVKSAALILAEIERIDRQQPGLPEGPLTQAEGGQA